jgi:hypothetical protein
MPTTSNPASCRRSLAVVAALAIVALGFHGPDLADSEDRRRQLAEPGFEDFYDTAFAQDARTGRPYVVDSAKSAELPTPRSPKPRRRVS